MLSKYYITDWKKEILNIHILNDILQISIFVCVNDNFMKHYDIKYNHKQYIEETLVNDV